MSKLKNLFQRSVLRNLIPNGDALAPEKGKTTFFKRKIPSPDGGKVLYYKMDSPRNLQTTPKKIEKYRRAEKKKKKTKRGQKEKETKKKRKEPKRREKKGVINSQKPILAAEKLRNPSASRVKYPLTS